MPRVKNMNFLDFLSESNQFKVPFNHDNFKINPGTKYDNLIGKINNYSLNFDKLYFFEEDENYYFADGVKRFTALYLLLCAICSKFYEDNEKEEYEKILYQYLLSEENESKLVLKDKDKVELNKIINGIISEGIYSENKIYESPILKTYAKFYLLLTTNSTSKNSLKNSYSIIYRNLNKITVPVKVISSEDSIKIFRQTNEKRLKSKYNQPILIKNYFLENLEHEYIDDFKFKWKELEEFEVIYNSLYKQKSKSFLNYFLKIYLNIKLGIIVTENKIYNNFIELVNEYNLKELYEDIYKYGSYFKKMFLKGEENDSLNICFENIASNCLFKRFNSDDDNQRYSYDEIKVFLLKVYEDYKKNLINGEDLKIIIKILESYIIRRDLCDFSSDNINKTFKDLYDNIEEENYLNSFILNISNLDKNIFPEDNRILNELINHDFFKEDDLKKYILDTLENSLRNEPINLEDYQIEHVMPQTIKDDWIKYLGENAIKINKKYKNNIGNLTLLKPSSNESLSNRPFDEKVNKKYDGYKYSDIRLSDDIIQSKVWNEKTIEERSRKLTRQIIKIWPYPTNYELNCIENIIKELDLKIKSFNTDIKRENKNNYMEYTLDNRNIINIYDKVTYIECRIFTDYNNIKTPKNIMGKYYNYENNVQCYLHDKSDIEYVLLIVRQAIKKFY